MRVIIVLLTGRFHHGVIVPRWKPSQPKWVPNFPISLAHSPVPWDRTAGTTLLFPSLAMPQMQPLDWPVSPVPWMESLWAPAVEKINQAVAEGIAWANEYVY